MDKNDDHVKSYAQRRAATDAEAIRFLSRTLADPIADFEAEYSASVKESLWGTAVATKAPLTRSFPPSHRNGTRKKRGNTIGGNQWHFPIARPAAAAVAASLFAALPASFLGLVLLAPSTADAIAASLLRPFVHNYADKVQSKANCQVMTPITAKNAAMPISYIRQEPNCQPVLFGVPMDENDIKNALPAAQAIEGEIIGTGTFLNWNVFGVGRFIKGALTGQKVGGSTLTQSAIETVYGNSYRLSGFEKFGYMATGTAFSAVYLVDPMIRANFALTNTACANTMPGTGKGFLTRAGNACAAIFGKSRIAELTTAETCVLYAAAKRQLRVPGENALGSDVRQYRKRIEWLKARAIEKCAPKLANGEVLVKLISEIKALKFPGPKQMRNQILGGTLVDEDVNRVVREFGLQRTEKRLIETNLDAALLAPMLETRLELLETVKPWLNKELCVAGCNDSKTFDVGLLVAEHKNGRLDIQHAHQSREGLLDPAIPHRSTASINKAFALPILEQEGITSVCKKKWGNLQDANGFKGFDCQNKKDFTSLRSAFAESSNLAMAYGLLQVRPEAFKDYLRQLGYSFNQRQTHSELVRGFIVGYGVQIGLTDFAQKFAALAFGHDVVTRPSLATTVDSKIGFNARDLFTDQTLRTSIDVMRGPVTDANGTARAAGEILENANCQIIMAKTGTSETTQNDGVRDRLFAIAARCSGKEIIAIGFVGSPQINIPIGSIPADAVIRWITKSLTIAANTKDRSKK